MKRYLPTLFVCLSLGTLAPLSAQDLTITNVRIIGPDASVIEHGSIVVRDGKIVSAAAGAPSSKAGKTIDAKGMTAIPGYIDAHKHINTGPKEKEQMEDLLEAGYTTILSGGGPAEGNITLREHIEKGVINGPRIIPSGRVGLRDTPEMARAQVKQLADMGIKWTGEIALTPVPGPSEHEVEVLKAVVDEGKKDGVTVQVHAVSSPAMMAAVDAGVRYLVHLPNKDFVTQANAKKLAETGTHILATIGFGVPVIGPPFASDNLARFRDGKPWPASIVDGDKLDGAVTGLEAGYMPVNARTVWDAGAMLGYCTDTGYEARAGLEHELKTFNLMFSMKDLVKIMGPNTAAYIQMSDQLGTLEPGKLADILLLDGDPMEGYWNWLKAKVVIKGGKIVVDKRGA